MDILCKKQLLIIFITVFSGQESLFGQQKTIIGRIVDETSLKPIEFAHIENYSRRITTFADTNGFFSLRASQGDTLVLSAIGFYYKMVVVSDSILGLSTISLFKLRERTYDIVEANIYIPGTYREFKHDFIDLDLPVTKTDALRQNLTAIARTEAKEAFDQAMAERKLDGISIISIPILSADEKARLRLKKIIEKEKIQNLVYEKFNPEIVKKVTGLTDENEIMAFMLFCDFKEKYLLEVNQYELMERIAAKYEEYQKKKKG